MDALSPLGVQHIDPTKWRLEVNGLVNTPLVFGYDEFQSLPMKSYSKSAHCVTSWSIEKPLWEGVPIKALADATSISLRLPLSNSFYNSHPCAAVMAAFSFMLAGGTPLALLNH